MDYGKAYTMIFRMNKMNATQRVEAMFKNLGAESVWILGSLIMVSWASTVHATKCAETLRKAGYSNVRSYMNGDESSVVVEGTMA